MAAILNFSKNILAIANSFGVKAAMEACADIAREKILHTRKHLLYALDPKAFVPTNKSFPEIEFSIVDSSELAFYASEGAYELSQEFLKTTLTAKVVLARNINDKTLAAYGFFSREPVAIAGEVIFEPPADSIYLFKFFVVSEFRGRQLVRALIAKIIEDEKQTPISAIIAIIISSNFVSQAAFNSMGFRQQFGFLVRKGARAVVKCCLQDCESGAAFLKRA